MAKGEMVGWANDLLKEKIFTSNPKNKGKWETIWVVSENIIC